MNFILWLLVAVVLVVRTTIVVFKVRLHLSVVLLWERCHQQVVAVVLTTPKQQQLAVRVVVVQQTQLVRLVLLEQRIKDMQVATDWLILVQVVVAVQAQSVLTKTAQATAVLAV
jgi:hypothetical protein